MNSLSHINLVDFLCHLKLTIKAGLSLREALIHIYPSQSEELKTLLRGVETIKEGEEFDQFMESFVLQANHPTLRRMLTGYQVCQPIGGDFTEYLDMLIRERY